MLVVNMTSKPRKWLTDEGVTAILQDLKTDKGIREIGRIHGVPHSTVVAIRDGKAYRHVIRT